MPGAEAQALVGIWRLEDCVAIPVDASAGESWRPHGEAPLGRLVYSPGGRVVVVLGDRHRAAFAHPDPRAGSPEECRAAVESFAAYTGHWRLEEGRVIHTIELAWVPPWTGSRQIRHAHLHGDRLRLSTDPTPVGGTAWVLHLDWIREE